ncbi:putative SppA [Clostridium perfringens D str. JGS1721]|uniref:Putative SppA n=1 Tax=Clostridium perfringens D str. JGS1721 TaxID=488537 RepID=B1V7H3_CLOPF|nr:putative SppA [Clostridium perfringens D str. JGS1721]
MTFYFIEFIRVFKSIGLYKFRKFLVSLDIFILSFLTLSIYLYRELRELSIFFKFCIRGIFSLNSVQTPLKSLAFSSDSLSFS